MGPLGDSDKYIPVDIAARAAALRAGTVRAKSGQPIIARLNEKRSCDRDDLVWKRPTGTPNNTRLVWHSP